MFENPSSNLSILSLLDDFLHWMYACPRIVCRFDDTLFDHVDLLQHVYAEVLICSAQQRNPLEVLSRSQDGLMVRLKVGSRAADWLVKLLKDM